jgi:hypothetical protein
MRAFETGGFSNDYADINPDIFLRFGKIITLG